MKMKDELLGKLSDGPGQNYQAFSSVILVRRLGTFAATKSQSGRKSHIGIKLSSVGLKSLGEGFAPIQDMIRC